MPSGNIQGGGTPFELMQLHILEKIVGGGSVINNGLFHKGHRAQKNIRTVQITDASGNPLAMVDNARVGDNAVVGG